MTCLFLPFSLPVCPSQKDKNLFRTEEALWLYLFFHSAGTKSSVISLTSVTSRS